MPIIRLLFPVLSECDLSMARWIRFGLNFVACTLILGVAVGGFLVLKGLPNAPEKRQGIETVYNVQVFDTESLNLLEIVSAFGTARADREVIVPAQVAGEITKLHHNLRVGLSVAAGDEPADILAQIDPRTYTERRDRVRSQMRETDSEITRLKKETDNNARLLEKARDDLETIQEQFQRVMKNKSRGAASASEVTRALLEVRQYEQTILQLENESALIPVRLEATTRRLESLKRDLRLADIDLENTTVYAPFNGSVSEVMVEKGQYVRVGDPLIRLTNTSLVEIPLPLALTDFQKIEGRLRAGEEPEVELAVNETAPQKWKGRVVRAAPEADASTRTVMVFVEVQNSEPIGDPSDTNPVPLRPGTFVHARIAGPLLSETIVIPRDAIVKGHVFVAKDGKAERRKIKTDTTLQSLVVVKDGLEPGDQVVLTNLDVVRDSVKLEVTDSVTLADELARQGTTAVRRLPQGE